jgi:iron complex transport system substrate-binding protein
MTYRLREMPERIVCLTEEPTETLYLLGEGARVVGISAYTCRPPEAKRDKPVVSAFVGGSVAKIKALEPDLVIGFSDIQADLAQQLVAENLQVLIFNQRSVQEILDTILMLGRIVGAEARARALVEGYVQGLAAAAERAQKRSRRPRVYFEEWDDPMISAIGWVSELIGLAGGEDIFSDRAAGKLASERFVSVREVVERAPEIYVACWCGKPFDRTAALARDGFSAIPAVRARRVHELDPAIILQPGPACLTDGLAALERIVDGA